MKRRKKKQREMIGSKVTLKKTQCSDDEWYITNGMADFYLTLLSFGQFYEQKRAHRVEK